MKTLDINLIQHANYCGLPSKFALRLKVLQYAQLTISAEEYAEFYAVLTPSEKFVADLLVREIENELLEEVGA